MNNARITEIFSSIQGEGKYVGEKQLFIRFSGCNLHCAYCDTEHEKGNVYSVKKLLEEIKKYDLNTIHSVSLTGGEPLLQVDFINEFAPLSKKTIYLETNGTLPDKLEKIIQNVDIIAADIKLDSCTKQGNKFDSHKEFLTIAHQSKVETFLKIIFDENIEEYEIEKSVNLAKEFNYEIFLQPKMTQTDFAFDVNFALNIFEKFKKLYQQTRFCPQMHKFWGVR